MRKQLKKVRAAKASDLGGKEKNVPSDSDVENDKEQNDDVADTHSQGKKGFFDTIITDGKRARSNPQSEKILRDWYTKSFSKIE
jgi:hypothetical protein